MVLGIGTLEQQIGVVVRPGGQQQEEEVKNIVISIMLAGIMKVDGMEIQFTQMENPILV